jgi:hypothetical protein
LKATRESQDTYLRAVRTAKERVSRLPPDQLRNLFDNAPVDRATSDLPVEVSIIRERHDSTGGILVVAQAFRPWVRWLPRGGNMFVVGFVLHPDDRITEPEPKDLWDYT